MGAWDRPPPDLPIGEFFERWLPEAYAASGRRSSGDAPVVRTTLSGEGGGAWDLRASEDGLEVELADRNPPGLHVRMSVRDFRAGLSGDPDLPELIPPRWGPLDMLFLDPRDVDLLRQVSGRILLEIAGRRGRRWTLDAALGKAGVSAGRPRSTVRVDGATFEGVMRGALPPMQPLLDGRIKIEGDRALAMQLLLLLASRLGR